MSKSLSIWKEIITPRKCSFDSMGTWHKSSLRSTAKARRQDRSQKLPQNRSPSPSSKGRTPEKVDLVFGLSRLPGLFLSLISLDLTFHHSPSASKLLETMDPTSSLLQGSWQQSQQQSLGTLNSTIRITNRVTCPAPETPMKAGPTRCPLSNSIHSYPDSTMRRGKFFQKK